jgi:hypothetical protein
MPAIRKEGEPRVIPQSFRLYESDYLYFKEIQKISKNVPEAFNKLVHGYKIYIDRTPPKAELFDKPPAEIITDLKKINEDLTVTNHHFYTENKELKNKIETLKTQLGFNSNGQNEVLKENEELINQNKALTLEIEELKNKGIQALELDQDLIKITKNALNTIDKMRPSILAKNWARFRDAQSQDLFRNAFTDMAVREVIESNFQHLL